MDKKNLKSPEKELDVARTESLNDIKKQSFQKKVKQIVVGSWDELEKPQTSGLQISSLSS